MAKSIRSEKCLRTMKQATNFEYGLFDKFEIIEDKGDFSEIIVSAASKFRCPVTIAVDNGLDVYRGKTKTRQKNVPMFTPLSSETKTTESSPKPETPLLASTLLIKASHDINNHLVEISMNKYKYCVIPRVLMHILRHILQRYTKLSKFVINDCFIDKYTIYELEKTLCCTRITDICLDSTFFSEGNYDILLEEATSLKHLSLRRCNINDEVCKRIIGNLDFSRPAEKVLLCLNLSSNRITDVGAQSVGEILRKNRHLRYLNLADNQITDDGAIHIFDALGEFPLSSEDMFNKRSRYIQYLQNKRAVYNKCLQDFEQMAFKKTRHDSKKMTTPRIKMPLNADDIDTKVELMTLGLVGPFQHPFNRPYITIKDDCSYCTGNLILSYLNLAYNNLMYPSLKKLHTVLDGQQSYINHVCCGLMKIVLVGNNLPERCVELESINHILSGRIIRHYAECRESTDEMASVQAKVSKKKRAAKSI